MEKGVVSEIVESAQRPLEIGGFLARPNGWTMVDPKSLISSGPVAEALKVYSLQAVVDYLTANRDALDLGKVVAHVVSPQIVRVTGPLDTRARNRETYVEATASSLTDGFLGKWVTIEEFIIGLQTRFVSTADLKAVLKLFGTVKHEGVKTLADDGVTQTVVSKAGVVMAAEAPVPNPVDLTPFRTFREVEQPVSPFVLRVNGANQNALSAGLFEADGGAWRIAAVEGVARWLRVAVPDGVAVLA